VSYMPKHLYWYNVEYTRNGEKNMVLIKKYGDVNDGSKTKIYILRAKYKQQSVNPKINCSIYFLMFFHENKSQRKTAIRWELIKHNNLKKLLLS